MLRNLAASKGVDEREVSRWEHRGTSNGEHLDTFSQRQKQVLAMAPELPGVERLLLQLQQADCEILLASEAGQAAGLMQRLTPDLLLTTPAALGELAAAAMKEARQMEGGVPSARLLRLFRSLDLLGRKLRSFLDPTSPQVGGEPLQTRDAMLRLLVVLEALLAECRQECDMPQAEDEVFDLRNRLRALAAACEQKAGRKGLQLLLHVGADVPRRFKGDVWRLEQALVRLLDNAVKRSNAGSVGLYVHLLQPETPAERLKLFSPESERQMPLRFSVRDSGVGLSPEQQRRIIDILQHPDETLDSQEDRQDDGQNNGEDLGLALASSLVRRLGGRLSVQSAPDKGAVFRFTVHLLQEQEPQQSSFSEEDAQLLSLSGKTVSPLMGEDAQQSPVTVVNAQGASALSAGFPCILAVDDSGTNRLLLQRYCKKLGYEFLVTASGGHQALEYLAGNHCDLVLMDVEMPGIDGMETTRCIREGKAGEAARRLPVVAMTAHAMEGSQQACLEAGMDGFIAKPLSMEMLRELLEQYFPPGKPGRHEKAAGNDKTQVRGSRGSLLNKYKAMERMGGDIDIYNELVGMFLQEHVPYMQALRQTRDTASFEAGRRSAHHLKNLFRTVGAESCGMLCAELETAAIGQNLESFAELLAILEQETAQLLPLLQK